MAGLDDVLDYLAAGASAVGLATAALADPTLPARLALELADWCARHGIDDVRELVGTALPRRRDRGSLRQGPWRLCPSLLPACRLPLPAGPPLPCRLPASCCGD